MFNLINEVVHEMESKKYVVGIFFDLRKTFDSIDHSLLLEKIEGVGVRDLVLDWIVLVLAWQKVVCGV